MKSFNQPATFQIILLLRTEDFKKLENTNSEEFKEIFLDEQGKYDCDVDLYSGYLVYKDRKSGNKIENDNESLTNVVMNDVFWYVNRKLYRKLLLFYVLSVTLKCTLLIIRVIGPNIIVTPLLKKLREIYMYQ